MREVEEENKSVMSKHLKPFILSLRNVWETKNTNSL